MRHDTVSMQVLITGVAGFIGSQVAGALLERGDFVIGIDNLNAYYDPSLKEARLRTLASKEGFTFHKVDMTDYDAMQMIVEEHRIERILHLAAQAGVRYSIEHPFTYEKNNELGTLNMLELARHHGVGHMIFASSSSVYGGNTEMPFHEGQDVSRPVSLYAATKKSGELMCHTYHHLYGIRCRCLRFFTVYGPWGRPDMALFTFTRNILEGRPIDVYNHGKMHRDFTFIDDIVQGVVAAIDAEYGYEIFNLARGESVELMTYIRALEDALGMKASMNMMEMQPGDVPATSADISKAQRMLAYAPSTSVPEGVRRFVDWYRSFYQV